MRKVAQEEYKKYLVGSKITKMLPFSGDFILDFDDFEFVIYDSSYWRVVQKNDIIASSEDIYVKCHFGTVDWPEIFPHSIMNTVESLDEYDEEKALKLLQIHLDKLQDELKNNLINKSIVDVNISPIGDVELLLSDDIRIQVFLPYTRNELDKSYELLSHK